MPVRSSSILPDMLVDTGWLESNLDVPHLRIVDIRGYVKTVDLGNGLQQAEYVGARAEYDAGHVPGSRYIDWTVDIVDLMSPVKVQIAPPAAFAAAMSARGIDDESEVVLVDHTGGHFATRLWWALRYYGFDHVALLDGGYNKWAVENRPLSTKEPVFTPATFTPRTRHDLRVEPGDVLAAIDAPGSRIVDARDVPTFTGEIRRHSRGGHIPSAVNVPAKSLVNADGTWKPLAEIRKIMTDGGVQPGERVIAYCNGGVTATAVLFALARTGHANFANYDGSWNEWGDRHDLPVQPGPNP